MHGCHYNQERNLVMPAEEEIDTVERSSIKKLKGFQTPRKHPLSQPVLFCLFEMFTYCGKAKARKFSCSCSSR